MGCVQEPPGQSLAQFPELADAWRQYIEPCIESVGVDRCMFESNFPPDKASSSYTVLWNHFKKLTRAYTSAERRAMFHDTALRVYRLPRH